MAKKKDDDRKIVADNRKARFAYAIESSLEAGIMLTGSEVKSLRTGRATISEFLRACQGRRNLLGQRPYPRIHPSQPLRP